jgi:hypothetical protein
MVNMGNMIKNVGVGVGNIRIGGMTMIPPLVAVGVGVGVGVLVGVDVGRIGVGGAAIIGSVSGIQAALVTEPAIHANPLSPPANSMYHHVPSKFFPATLAVPPWGIEPIMLYACPGPLRTFAFVFVVIVGTHASVVGLGVSDATGVNVVIGVSVSVVVSTGPSVAGAPPGRLQASMERTIKNADRAILLFFTGMRFSSGKLVPAL